jgi:hypothetical protein
MKRSTKAGRSRWTEKPRSERYPQQNVRPLPKDEPTERPALGPYEVVYDVALGYSHERSIVLP